MLSQRANSILPESNPWYALDDRFHVASKILVTETPVNPASTLLTATQLRERVAAVGRALATSLAALIDAVPGGPHQPIRLARELGINKDLSSRVLTATRAGDPITVAHTVPGPRPLRALLQAIAAKGVDRALIDAAERAIGDFELLINDQLGDRSALDAIIADWLPGAREKAELLSKQSAFRGMRHLKGVEVETAVSTQLIHPSADPDFIDIVFVTCLLGLRRLRPSATVKLLDITLGAMPEGRVQTTLAGARLDTLEGQRSVALPEFCDRLGPDFSIEASRGQVRMLLPEGALGLRSVVDHVFVVVHERAGRRRSTSPGRGGVGAAVATPARLLVNDVFVADGTVAGEPTLAIYDTSVQGLATVTDDSRACDRYSLAERTHLLGRGFWECQIAESPRYVDLLNHIVRLRGWNPAAFRGYRCRVEYPILGSQIAQIFEKLQA